MQRHFLIRLRWPHQLRQVPEVRVNSIQDAVNCLFTHRCIIYAIPNHGHHTAVIQPAPRKPFRRPLRRILLEPTNFVCLVTGNVSVHKSRRIDTRISTFSCGSTPAITLDSGMPTCFATALAVVALSPEIIQVASFRDCR